MSVTLHRATLDDVPQLAEIGSITFIETFGHLYTPQDLRTFLDNSRSRSRYARMVTDARIGIWLASAEGAVPIAYCVAGTCKLPVENLEPAAGEIQELYVRGEHRGLQLGTRLLHTALAWLNQQSFSPLYLGVWSENRDAQRLYARFGFEKVGEYGFPVGGHVDREYILKKR